MQKKFINALKNDNEMKVNNRSYHDLYSFTDSITL